MQYMANDPERRESVARWFPPAKSVILLGFSYDPKGGPPDEAPPTGRVARYAVSPDYHHVLRAKLEELALFIRDLEPSAQCKPFVDSSPVLERLYGRYAGIGWVGKNTMLISTKIGSYFFLCGLALDRELEYDEPVPDHCGTCGRCIEACPTGAFPQPRVLDAAKCIAYLTIEHRGSIPEPYREKIGDWVFGCDICQEVCPWNRFSVQTRCFPAAHPARPSLEKMARISPAEFKTELGATPQERARYRGFVRNALLAMGNAGDASSIPTLEEFSKHKDPVLSEQARWSLKRLGAAALALLAALAPLPVFSQTEAQTPSATRPAARKKGAGIPTPTPTKVPEGMPRDKQEHKKQPWPLELLLQPLKKGMFIRLPVVDSDPNRGVTYGVMPIWVFQEEGTDRIKHIHAPSFTYNKIFKATPTYRYYYYPTKHSNFVTRGSWSRVTDREAVADYQDYRFLGYPMMARFRFHFNVDGSRRFFGVGPGTVRSEESNYIHDSIQYEATVGPPLYPNSLWNIVTSHNMSADKISDGPIDKIRNINEAFPGAAGAHRHQHSSLRVAIERDTRDSPVTTTEGAYLQFSGESSQREFASEFTYQRYGVDARYFHQNTNPKQRTVGALKFEQLIGTAPFYLLPQLGGKYVHRAYGEGRYIDKGMISLQLEQRIVVYSVAMAGVSTDLEVAPFVGAGTVFRTPQHLAGRFIRPVLGSAIRAIARPQVVGSVDFGVGQEGLSAFMDINYSF